MCGHPTETFLVLPLIIPFFLSKQAQDLNWMSQEAELVTGSSQGGRAAGGGKVNWTELNVRQNTSGWHLGSSISPLLPLFLWRVAQAEAFCGPRWQCQRRDETEEKQQRSINQPIHALRKQDTLLFELTACEPSPLCRSLVPASAAVRASSFTTINSSFSSSAFPPCVFPAAADLQRLSRWAGATCRPRSWHKVGWSTDGADVPVWVIEGGVPQSSLHLPRHQMTNNWLCTQRWGPAANWWWTHSSVREGESRQEGGGGGGHLFAAENINVGWSAFLFFFFFLWRPGDCEVCVLMRMCLWFDMLIHYKGAEDCVEGTTRPSSSSQWSSVDLF